MDVTYTSLVADTAADLKVRDSGLDAELPRLVGVAEEQCRHLLHPDVFEESAEVSVTAGDAVVDLSGGLTVDTVTREVLSLRGMTAVADGRRWTLYRKGYEELALLYPFSDHRDYPVYYTEVGGWMRHVLFPVPVTDLSLTITANVRAIPLSGSNDTNTLTDRAPWALRACLRVEAARWLRMWDSLEAYEAERSEAVRLVNNSVSRRQRDESQPRPDDTTNRGGT